MGMIAVRGYIRGLREAHGLTRNDVASQVSIVLGRSIDTTTIWRIEVGKQNPGLDIFLSLLGVLKGSPGIVQLLFDFPDASEEDGYSLARDWVSWRGDIDVQKIS